MGSAPVGNWMRLGAAAVMFASAMMAARCIHAASQDSVATRSHSVFGAVAREIDTLKREIADLEAHAAGLLRDNKDLTARLRRRADSESVVPEPAVSGEAAVLVTTRTNEVEDRVVLVWTMSGGLMAGAKVMAKMRSGFPVRTLGTERSGGQDWVQCYTYHFTPDSLGWVVAQSVRRDHEEASLLDER